MWIYRVARTMRALGGRGTSRSRQAGRSAGIFVPIANLWKPYQAMSEIWRASRNPRGWQNDEPASPGLVVGDLVVSTVLGKIATG